MIDKLKACFYILLAKQYVVFTADRANAYKRTYAEMYKANKAFLAAVVFYIRGAEIIRWAYVADLLPDRKEVHP